MSSHTCSDSQSGRACYVMSRRRFLGTAATGLAAATLAAPSSSAQSLQEESIDIGSFRPKAHVRIVHAVARLKPPYWLGWPGTAYDVEGHRRDYARKFSEAARHAGIALEQRESPLEDESAVSAFMDELTANPPHAVLVSLQHFDVWPWADRIAALGLPTVVFAPVGMGFTNHVKSVAHKPGVHEISSLEVAPVEQAFRLVRAKRQLEETRLLVVSGERASEERMEHLGLTVRRIPYRRLRARFEVMSPKAKVRDAVITRLLNDEACHAAVLGNEPDINGAVSWLFARYAFDDALGPLVLRAHSGFNTGVPLRDGEAVTLVRFTSPHELKLGSGTVSDNAVTHAMNARRVRPAVFRGNRQRNVEAFCRLYGIEIIASSDSFA